MNKLANVAVGGKNPVRIMGIINTSPESFFKKTIVKNKTDIANLVEKMEQSGANFIDIGGMSTAPYLTTFVTEKVESRRILNAIKVIQNVSNLPICVDTCRAQVAREALQEGAEVINDISGLKFDKNMVKVIEKFQPSLVLCAFSNQTVRGNHLIRTKELLKESLHLAKSADVPLNKIVIDPAIGFFRKKGKGPFYTKIISDWFERDLLILKNLKSIKNKQPLLISVSNKSFIGKLLNKDNPKDRLYGSLVTEAIAVLNGADIIRTHNVSETKQAVDVAQKLAQKKPRKAYNTS